MQIVNDNIISCMILKKNLEYIASKDEYELGKRSRSSRSLTRCWPINFYSREIYVQPLKYESHSFFNLELFSIDFISFCRIFLDEDKLSKLKITL